MTLNIVRGAAAAFHADANNFLAVEVGDERIVVIDHEAEFADVIGVLDRKDMADVNGRVAALHVGEHGTMLVVTAVAEASLANLPSRGTKRELVPICRRMRAGEVLPIGILWNGHDVVFGWFTGPVAARIRRR